MSNTCIVCLGDLGDDANPPITPERSSPRPTLDDAEPPPPAPAPPSPPVVAAAITDIQPLLNTTKETEKIAHLLPCGHNLHDDCLKPWVERANSCPICRQSFNMVELSDKIGGPIISSYAVQDRVQVAEIDPSMLIEEVDDDSDSQPCPLCGDGDNEDLLLLCDGCDVGSHTYCVGLDSVPAGPWYCEQCETQRAIIISQTAEPSSRSQNPPGRRTRGQQRRLRSQNQMNAFHWARVWQTVYDHLNIDLDFPFDDQHSASRILERQRREASNRREFEAWERRFRVAERQGGANRLRDLLEIGRGRPSRPRPVIVTPEPESVDEVRAWNAFERAREIQDAPSSARRKRKSPTASPVDPEPAQPERRLKRPRTRRPQDLAEAADHGGESSRAARLPSAIAPLARSPEATTTGPSFLQSLLKEVEDSSAPNRSNGVYRPSTISSNPPVDQTSPGPSSPALSPLPSNHSSPRPSSTTPPPFANGRTLSPTPLTSTIEPIFPSPEFSPSRSPGQDSAPCGHVYCARERSRTSRRIPAASISPSRRRTDETSPSRAELSLSAKSEVQQMVKAALKPHYRDQAVSKDQYTEINRRVSRMLYDRVGVIDTLNAEDKAKWEAIATAEVSKAVDALQGESGPAGSSNDGD